jgi:hypothetical protein
MLIAADGKPVDGREIMAAVYPWKPWPEWRWRDMRKSASRYADRILQPRSRPLMWRPKPALAEIMSAADETKSDT